MWSQGVALPGWLEGLILVCVLFVLPVWVMTLSAPVGLLSLLSNATLGMLGVITGLSIMDLICTLRKLVGKQSLRKSDEVPLLQGQAYLNRNQDVEIGKAEPVVFSLIVPCFLPNEVDIIEDTVDHFVYNLDYEDDYQVILVYNSTAAADLMDPVQQLEYRLKERAKVVTMGKSRRELVVKRCHTSTSKAENINYAVSLASGNVLGIFDADHHPMKNVLDELRRLWTPETSAMQGSCFVRNQDRNMLTRLIAIEEGLVFNVHHTGGSAWRGFGVFGGSNGFWRKQDLNSLLMDKEMLTEDIDVSLRALRNGALIRHEPTLISSELVPETMDALWRQRLRWAQGWFQCSYKHFTSLVGSKELSMRQKFGIVVMFLMREVWYYLLPTSMVVTATVFLRRYLELDPKSLLHGHEGPAARIIFVLFILTFTTELLISYAMTPRSQRLSFPWVLYGIVSFLPFVYFLVLVGITAQFREMYGRKTWVCTSRPSSVQSQSMKADSDSIGRSTRSPGSSDIGDTAPERVQDPEIDALT